MPIPQSPEEMKEFAERNGIRPKFKADQTTLVYKKPIRLPGFIRKSLTIDCEGKDLAATEIKLRPGGTLKLLNLRSTIMVRGDFVREEGSTLIVTNAADPEKKEHIVPVDIDVHAVVQD